MVNNYLIACKVEGKSPRTIGTYSMVLGSFLCNRTNGKQPVSPASIRAYLLSLQERLKPVSLHIYHRSLKTFFNWLVMEGFLEENPMWNMKAPKVPKPTIKPFTETDIHNLLLLCSGGRFLDFRNRAIILVFLDTGLRLGEMARIQNDDVDFSHETITVMGKGAKERVVRIGKGAQKALLKYLLLRDDKHPCLWVTEERRPMTVSAIQTMIKRLCRRIGITDSKIGPHTFRHTAATMALRNGASPFDVQSLLGHSTLVMTRRYTETVNSQDAVKRHKLFSPVDCLKLK
jgi:site-specific recombinase XerD